MFDSINLYKFDRLYPFVIGDIFENWPVSIEEISEIFLGKVIDGSRETIQSVYIFSHFSQFLSHSFFSTTIEYYEIEYRLSTYVYLWNQLFYMEEMSWIENM